MFSRPAGVGPLDCNDIASNTHLSCLGYAHLKFRYALREFVESFLLVKPPAGWVT
jgi:hypothetical protein